MHGKIPLHKSKDERLGMLHVVRVNAKDAYIRGTEKSLIMSVTTEQVHYVTWQLGLCLGTQTEYVNLLEKLIKIVNKFS